MQKLLSRLFFLTLFLSSFCLTAQNVSQIERPTAVASAITTDPALDGEVLNDEIWQSITPIGRLLQQQPNFGQPATEKTDVKIAYTPKMLYIGVVCYDADPDKLVVSDARRDASLEGTDAVLFLVDTYHDGQNGFVFGTSVNGLEYDAQLTNEGQGNFSQNRQQGGMIGGFNINWDAGWQVKTQVGDYGWSAEFAIPFRTIRFKPGKDRTWGFNFRRNIRKNNQIAYWSPVPFMLDLNRVSLAGDLTGLDLQNPGNLKVIPYVLGQGSADYTLDDEWDFRADAGGEIKYSVTPSMTLDLTVNTDFAQVEVDDQQVNLDRFNLFFPEKRPFFLENAGFFAIGSPGEVDIFFSRKIGLDEEGTPIPIIAGGRLSGRINKTNIGFLSMFTEEIDQPNDDIYVQANNFTVARVSHEFAPRSLIGGAFTSRQGMSGLEDDFNRTYTLDGRLGLGKRAQLSGFFSTSETPNVDDRQHALQFTSSYNWDGWILNASYTEVAENYNPEVGFLFREAFRKPEFLIFKNIRSKSGKFGFLEFRPHVSYRGYWDFNGFYETGFLHIDNHFVWKDGAEVHTGINFRTEGLKERFEISKDIFVEPGTYDQSEAQLVFFTNPSKPVTFRYFSQLGGRFGGKRYLNSVTLGLRIGNKFNSEYTFSRNDFEDIGLEKESFNTNVFQGRLSYNFTPLIFAQGLIQYNSVRDLWSANLRFGWLQQANTGLFVVFNLANGSGNGDFDPINNRLITIKYSRMFDVLK